MIRLLDTPSGESKKEPQIKQIKQIKQIMTRERCEYVFPARDFLFSKETNEHALVEATESESISLFSFLNLY